MCYSFGVLKQIVVLRGVGDVNSALFSIDAGTDSLRV